MKLHLPVLGLALGLSLSFHAQNNQTIIPHRTCGTDVPSAEWNEWFNQKVEEYKEQQALGKVQQSTYVIPVIVHVIHGGQAVGTYPNISQTQINSQINVLNADFAGTGLNSGNLAATGFSVVGAANTNITFCLATKDPNGLALAEPGIERISYVAKGWSNPTSFTSPSTFQNFINTTVKPNTIWNPAKYLNIWVTDCSNNVGLLGYATFPAGSGLSGIPGGTGSSTSDGIWNWARAFGNTGTLLAPYNKGRTATHEIGHWLGLRHIGGDASSVSGDCNASDFCNDTPPQKGGANGGQYGQNYGGPAYPLHATGSNSCSAAAPNGDMFMNFMDYTDDAFMYMFTPGQATRMQTAMQNGTYRSQLTANSTSLCGATTALKDLDVSENVFTIYPNPVKGVVTLTYGGNTPLNVLINNSLGQLVFTENFNDGSGKYKIDLSNFPSGVYFVTLKNANEKVIKRLIVN
jgi:hypothetical protein